MDAARSLSVLSNFRRELAKAESLGEVKDLRDKAASVRQYCKAANMGVGAVNAAVECKLMAERKAGTMLAGMEKRKRNVNCDSLSQLGIERKQSSRWQRIASVPEEKFETHLATFRESHRELTTASVLKLAARQPKEADAEQPQSTGIVSRLSELGEQKFGTIYADPPWKYCNQATRASTDNHYDTLSVDELCEWPVGEYAAERSHLHLWTTNGFLPDAFRVIEAWGFEYKSCFVWCKPQMGIGNYWRVSHEFMLLGVRGALTFRDKGQMSWRSIPRGKHSSKPDLIRDVIEACSPGPYLELFGRNRHDGWTILGNQVAAEMQRKMA